jgi:5-methyltetrahydrofolate--homocysteine methyltransferase
MGRMSLNDRLKQGLFLLDGAMGTELIARGVEPGTCNDYLNVQSPDIVFDIHCAYLRAGSDAVLTNTFGANKYALARHGLADRAEEINGAGARIARQAAREISNFESFGFAQDKSRISDFGPYVLGDIGPSGDFLEPLGTLQSEQLKAAFAEQANGLLAGGVDGFIIETMTALDEAKIATEAVKSVCGKLPLFVSFAFDRVGSDFRTMMGVDVTSAVAKMVSLGVDAVGFNCGTASLDEYVELTNRFVSTVKALEKTRATRDERRVTIFAEPNAGRPELIDGRAVYEVSPEDFAAAAARIHSAGVNIIGGCCGTGPKHIAAVSRKLRAGTA